jgi:hypothetical protein
MWQKLSAAMAIALAGSCFSVVNAADDVSALISSCAKDTGAATCPVTYQTIGAGDCLTPQAEGNRACLIRMASQAAAANDCDRAYRLVYACQCQLSQEEGRTTIKAAGPNGVCSALRAMK